MSGQDVYKSTLEIYLKQYEQCWQDKRNLEAMIWQTPTISLAIVSVLLAALISQKFALTSSATTNSIAALVVLLFVFAISLVATIQLRKHRLFCDIRTMDLRHIEACLRPYGLTLQPLFKTSEVSGRQVYDVKQGFVSGLSAYNWLFGLMVIVTIALLIAVILVPLLLLSGIL